ncbi:hypothetical protein MLD63_00720 (plasmid) [Paracoccus sp. TK19116]|uniref:Uncharacterized protein n=1 Tax=Paracoccus albicereus TaxID=2922394 RepID=A0ABT1MPS8_9RHOB|nr:hypothetical protein [Paracoccus albicereus]MCQ0968956.1 hypothetical protein [Paracoccus albicereus]
MADDALDAARADPKGLIRESFRIDGITLGECRTIFLDWALSLPDGVAPAEAMRAVLDLYAPDGAGGRRDHPMVTVLSEGLAAAARAPVRRGGRAGRFAQ